MEQPGASATVIDFESRRRRRTRPTAANAELRRTYAQLVELQRLPSSIPFEVVVKFIDGFCDRRFRAHTNAGGAA